MLKPNLENLNRQPFWYKRFTVVDSNTLTPLVDWQDSSQYKFANNIRGGLAACVSYPSADDVPFVVVEFLNVTDADGNCTCPAALDILEEFRAAYRELYVERNIWGTGWNTPALMDTDFFERIKAATLFLTDARKADSPRITIHGSVPYYFVPTGVIAFEYSGYVSDCEPDFDAVICKLYKRAKSTPATKITAAETVAASVPPEEVPAENPREQKPEPPAAETVPADKKPQENPREQSEVLPREQRESMALAFLQKFFRFVPDGNFYSYFWCKRKRGKRGEKSESIWFKISDTAEMTAAISRAFDLNDAGYETWFGINATAAPKDEYHRAEVPDVVLQFVVPIDIDCAFGNHKKPGVYPPDVETAKSFLPAPPTFLNHSGGGIHALYLLEPPRILNSAAEREAAAALNFALKDVVERRGSQFTGVDSVGDLPRIMRLPGTFNHKGSEPVLCYVISDDGKNYTPDKIDEIIRADSLAAAHNLEATAAPAAEKSQRCDICPPVDETASDDPPELKHALAVACMNVVSPQLLKDRDTEWLPFFSGLKHAGISFEQADAWCQLDFPERYVKDNVRKEWDSLNDSNYNLATLVGFAKKYAYFDAVAFKRKWYREHPEHQQPPAKNSRAARRTAATGDTTDNFPNCPVLLKAPAGFELDADGIYVGGVKISSPVVVTRILQSTEARVELKIYDDGNWHAVRVERATIAASRKLLELANYNLAVTETGAKALCGFLTQLITSNDIERVKVFSQPGWHDGTFIYPARDGVLIEAGVDYEAIFKTQGDYDDWKKMLAKYVGTITAARVTIGAALTAPALKILGIRNQHLHLAYRSGSGKTALQKLAGSIYGDSTSFVRSLNATSRYHEESPVAYNDLPNILDEVQTVSAVKRAELITTVFNLAEGITRGRLDKNANKRPRKYFRTTTITTGEQTLSAEQTEEGAIARCLEYTVAEDLPDATDIYHAETFGHAGYPWTQWLTKHAGELKALFVRFRTELNQKFPDAYDNHKDFVAAIFACGSCFLKMLNLDDAFSKNFAADTAKIFNSLPHRSAGSSCDKALRVVADFVAANFARFPAIDSNGTYTSSERSEHEYTPTDIYGCQEITSPPFDDADKQGTVYIIPTVLTKKALRDDPSPTTRLREFLERGYVERSDNKDRPWCVQRKVNGKYQRFVAFDIQTLFPPDNSQHA